MPGWSAFAESAEAAVGVEALGLVWPGTEPVASQTLEKIGFKRICYSVDLVRCYTCCVLLRC